ncbi:MAG: hypothetical protein H0V66_08425 [Bdellovibrionales bacterium]|nr:hypothetical protein [Bdellovibrionales bacterium]
MKNLLLLLCFLPLSAFASWQVEVALGIDGETWKIDHAKFEESKETALTLGRYLVKLTIKKSKEENGLDVTYVVQEKKGEQFILVNKGDDIIEIGQKSNEIYAKGEPKQPNSIITLKFKPTK